MLVFACLGEETSKIFIESIQKKELSSFICFYTKPLGWEGIKRGRVSRYTENIIKTIFPTHISVDLNSLLHFGMLDNKLGIEHYLDKVDNLLYNLIRNLIIIFS